MKLNENEREKLYQKMLDNWGEEAQMRMCIEEMSELIKEICKYLRYNQLDEIDKIDQTKENIIEETADVINCIEQLRYLVGKEKVDNVRDFKLDRVEKRLEKYIQNNKS